MLILVPKKRNYEIWNTQYSDLLNSLFLCGDEIQAHFDVHQGTQEVYILI